MSDTAWCAQCTRVPLRWQCLYLRRYKKCSPLPFTSKGREGSERGGGGDEEEGEGVEPPPLQISGYATD